MIRFIAFAAFALALATSAQAMSAPPLHRADGMTTETQDVGYRYRGVAATAGIGATAMARIVPTAIGATAMARIVPTAIGATAMARIVPTAIGATAMELAVELPAAISAEDSSGSETPTEGRSFRVSPTENQCEDSAVCCCNRFRHRPRAPRPVHGGRAATTCKDAAKMDFPNDRKSRKAFKKECKAAWKASQHG